MQSLNTCPQFLCRLDVSILCRGDGQAERASSTSGFCWSSLEGNARLEREREREAEGRGEDWIKSAARWVLRSGLRWAGCLLSLPVCRSLLLYRRCRSARQDSDRESRETGLLRFLFPIVSFPLTRPRLESGQLWLQQTSDSWHEVGKGQKRLVRKSPALRDKTALPLASFHSFSLCDSSKPGMYIAVTSTYNPWSHESTAHCGQTTCS